MTRQRIIFWQTTLVITTEHCVKKIWREGRTNFVLVFLSKTIMMSYRASWHAPVWLLARWCLVAEMKPVVWSCLAVVGRRQWPWDATSFEGTDADDRWMKTSTCPLTAMYTSSSCIFVFVRTFTVFHHSYMRHNSHQTWRYEHDLLIY